MWHYSGVEDTTQTHPEEVSKEIVAQWLRSITGAGDNPLGAKQILPFSVENPPPNLELMNMYSPVANGGQPDDGEESAGGNIVTDYGDDSEGGDDDSEESEEYVESPPRAEQRSKQHQDPATVPSRTLPSRTRNPKRDRAATYESTKKVAKQPKSALPKPRKALPHMKIGVPVASTTALPPETAGRTSRR
ncbi:hypothetical protein ZWY2020_042451 [Hordeum vulgare]|nr:hypothetical protein ZWY2020_042451 [Hordeum vulgare]